VRAEENAARIPELLLLPVAAAAAPADAAPPADAPPSTAARYTLPSAPAEGADAVCTLEPVVEVVTETVVVPDVRPAVEVVAVPLAPVVVVVVVVVVAVVAPALPEFPGAGLEPTLAGGPPAGAPPAGAAGPGALGSGTAAVAAGRPWPALARSAGGGAAGGGAPRAELPPLLPLLE
jgi:hypothetical protein